MISADWTVPDVLEAMGHDPVDLQTFLDRHVLREKWLRMDHPAWAWRASSSYVDNMRLKVKRTPRAIEFRHFLRRMIEDRAKADTRLFQQVGGDYMVAHAIAGATFDAWPRIDDVWLYTELVERFAWWGRKIMLDPAELREGLLRIGTIAKRAGKSDQRADLIDKWCVEQLPLFDAT